MERIEPSTVFPAEHTDRVDFEIAFTALVVTTVLSIPTTDFGYKLLKALVILLSGLTLLRKMAVTNQHSPSEPTLRWTMPFIEAITVVATTHLLLEAGASTTEQFALNISPIVIAAPLIPIFMLAVFGLHERVFGDASLYLALLSHNAAKKAEDSSLFGYSEELRDRFLDSAVVFVMFSNSSSIPPELGWLEYRGESEATPSFVPIIVVGLLGYGLIWAITAWLFGSSVPNIVFLLFVFLLKYPIQFWYSRFGLARFMPDRSGWVDALVVFLGLVVANMTILPRYG